MKKSKSVILMGISFLLGITLSFSVVSADGEPGSQNDPLVTKSYVDNQIQKQLQTINAESSTGENTKREIFVVVEGKKGDKIYFGQSTEVILRSGIATAIVSDLGGLSDVSDGYDLKMGQELEKNHLILIPRDDGRGVNLETDAFFMIKGPYQLEHNQEDV